MHKHFTKRIVAGLLTAAMIVPLTVSLSEPQGVSAENGSNELLGETTFDYKIVPWMPVEASPAKQNFMIEDGAVHLTILKGKGASLSNYDLQFRHRNLEFRKDHKYMVSFKAKAARDGMELCSRIDRNSLEDPLFMLDGQSGEMIMGPAFGGMWGTPLKLTTEFKEYSGLFTPTEDIEGAEWIFTYAYDDTYGGNAQDGDELWFDDMSIKDITWNEEIPQSSYGYTARGYSGLENNFISVNQLGYLPGLAKIATLSDNSGDVLYEAETLNLDSSYDYEIINVSDDTVAYTGKTEKKTFDADSGDYVCKIDFTKFNTEGEYYIRIKGREWRSFPFRIGSDVYQEKDHDLLTNALNYFYQNRAGIDIEEKYITSGEKEKLAHAGQHNTESGFVQTRWRNEYLTYEEASRTYASSEIDVKGGWYASGNQGKYMPEGGMTVWTLQNMYERALQTASGRDKFADGSGTVVIPEAGNKIPDILDECKHELDFMSKMKVSSNEPTWGKYAGLYYHKVQDHKWIEIATKPWDYVEGYEIARIVKPPTYAATLNFAACAAQAARLWQDYDADQAAVYLKQAKEAYAAFLRVYQEPDLIMTAHPEYWTDCPKEELNEVSLFAPMYQAKGGEPYGDFQLSDDAYWAVCELYISAKEMNDSDAESYYEELKKYNDEGSFIYNYKDAFRFQPRINGGENLTNDGSYTVFNWGNTGAAGCMSLMLHKDLLSPAEALTLEQSLLDTADTYLKIENEQGYGIPYKYEPDYSEPIGSPTIVIQGFEYGSNERVLNNTIALAYAYDLTGDTKYMNGVVSGMDYLLGNNPLAYSYITGYGSYHVKNPTHRYWCAELDKTFPAAPDGVLSLGPNAGLQDQYVRALGFVPGKKDSVSERCYADSVESWATNAVSLTSNASLAWVVSYLQDYETPMPAGIIVPGDADGNGKANVADAVMLTKYLLGSGWIRNPKAADMNADNKLTAADLTLLKRELLK